MTRFRKMVWLGGGLLGLLILVGGAAAIYYHHKKPVSMLGAIVKQDTDVRKQSPISDVDVTAVGFTPAVTAKSDFSGFFRLRLPLGIRRGTHVTLQFRRTGYQPLDADEVVSDDLYVVPMIPVQTADETALPGPPPVTVGNVIVRYSIETTNLMNVGSEISTFQVENKGNIPCHRRRPCSPDGKWKAAIGSGTLDAGDGNVFDDARVSCIAGPCPFTRVVSDSFAHDVKMISVSVLDWSDTTTFLLQAEVYRQQISDIVRESYPVIFGQSINFTLPPAAEGPSLEAEINNIEIVFPLGPAPTLSWANCDVRVEKDQSKTYRCELKANYTFRSH